MTSEHSDMQGAASDPFAYMYPFEFVLLVTFRKNGIGVPTAMWFAHERGNIYMVTSRTAGEIKRIRNNAWVLLASRDSMGKMLGPRIEALAHELPPARHASANASLARKYGAQYETIPSSEAVEEDEETFIEIEPIQKHRVTGTRRLPDSNADSKTGSEPQKPAYPGGQHSLH